MTEAVWLIPILPLFGAIINGLAGNRIGKKAVGFIGCTAVGLSHLILISTFFHLSTLPHLNRSITVAGFEWFASGYFRIDFSLLIDPLSILIGLVVTGVGFLIHIYSLGYMHADKAYWRYFSYLNLFIFFMLLLVLSADYIVMYLGWEGVGLCSYLLIGFWYEKKTASDAGKKAFIVNRVGDAGFILGLFLLFWSLSELGVYSLKFQDVFENAPRLDPARLTWITLLLFAGAMGKSAQFPLHVWLPDAMEGPTPVSALIHAATMVTAGVYMVARSSVLFTLAPISGEIVASIGILTAFFAATIALVQNDIKRVLAYSTISQLGYMFAAVGIGAYSAGIFHLISHAFIKGLLFLGAGSVIHALSGDQDMRNMGGLSRHMKITSVTFIIGAIALAGIPPTSGFWSKDEILWELFQNGHYIIAILGLLTVFLTAFYLFKLVFMVFLGKPAPDRQIDRPIDESPRSMTIPLIALAVLALGGGVIGISFFGGESFLHVYLSPVFEPGSLALPKTHGTTAFVMMAVSVTLGLLGIFLAALFYLEPLRSIAPKFLNPGEIAKRFNGIYQLLCNKYYVDEFYAAAIVRPVKRFCQICLSFDLFVIDGVVNGAGWLTRLVAWLSHQFDSYLVDGAVNSLASVVNIGSRVWGRIQTGYLQNYALVFILGILFIIGGVMLVI